MATIVTVIRRHAAKHREVYAARRAREEAFFRAFDEAERAAAAPAAVQPPAVVEPVAAVVEAPPSVTPAPAARPQVQNHPHRNHRR